VVVLVVEPYVCVGCTLLGVISLCIVISASMSGVKPIIFVCIYPSTVVVPVVCSFVLYSQWLSYMCYVKVEQNLVGRFIHYCCFIWLYWLFYKGRLVVVLCPLVCDLLCLQVDGGVGCGVRYTEFLFMGGLLFILTVRSGGTRVVYCVRSVLWNYCQFVLSCLLWIIVSMFMVIVLQLLGGGLRIESARMSDHLVLVLVYHL